jgi:hypothetical protein
VHVADLLELVMSIESDHDQAAIFVLPPEAFFDVW